MAARSLDIRKGLACDAHISETRKVKMGGVGHVAVSHSRYFRRLHGPSGNMRLGRELDKGKRILE